MGGGGVQAYGGYRYPQITVGNLLTKIFNWYACGRFVVNVVLMDQKFDKIVDEVPNLEFNTTAAIEHVGEC